MRVEYLLWLKLMMHFSIGILFFAVTIESDMLSALALTLKARDTELPVLGIN
jgi:hypothetical protein